MSSRPLFLLSKTTGWYGAHSGYYEQVARRSNLLGRIRLIPPRRAYWWRRCLGWLYTRLLNAPSVTPMAGHAELRLLVALLFNPVARGIVLNMDDRLDMLRRWRKAPRRLVGVIHLPPGEWTPRQRQNLSRLSSAIVLWRAAVPEIEALIGPGRVRVALHGVDTAFFCPPTAPREDAHLLCCGQYLRDFEALATLFRILQSRHPGLRLTIIVPKFKVQGEDLAWCRSTPNVELLSGLTDAELLGYFQRCTVLLLPLIDAGANNTVLEALACGLPIATNDIGGIRDYGGGTAFPLAADRTHALAELTHDYLINPQLRTAVAQRQRSVAETLDWTQSIPALQTAVDELTLNHAV